MQRQKNVGIVGGKLQPCPSSPNCVSSYANDSEHGIKPFSLKQNPQASLDRLAQIVSKLPRTSVVTKKENYLHAEFKSAVFGFVDDVEFLADANSKVVHVRSASRLGRSDFGVNRKRVEHLRKLYE